MFPSFQPHSHDLISPYPVPVISDLMRCAFPHVSADHTPKSVDSVKYVVHGGQLYTTYMELNNQPPTTAKVRLQAGVTLVERLRELKSGLEVDDIHINEYLDYHLELKSAVASVRSYFPSHLKDIDTAVRLFFRFYSRKNVVSGESRRLNELNQNLKSSSGTDGRKELGLICMSESNLTNEDVACIWGWLTFLPQAEAVRVWHKRPDIAMVQFNKTDDVVKVEIIQRVLHQQHLSQSDIAHMETHSQSRKIVEAAAQRSAPSNWVCAICSGTVSYANNVCYRHANVKQVPPLKSAGRVVSTLQALGKDVGTARQVQTLARWLQPQISNSVAVSGRFTEIGLHYGVSQSETAANHMCLAAGCRHSALVETDSDSSDSSDDSKDPDYDPLEKRDV